MHKINFQAQNGMKRFLFIIIFISLSFALLGTSLGSSSVVEGEATITAKLVRVPLSEVFDIITSQTGFTVKYDGKVENQLISGEFNSIELNSFLKRVLKDENSLITVLPKMNIVTVQTFGSRKNSSRLDAIEPKTDSKGTEARSNMPLLQEQDDVISGGINELNETPPPVVSGNNHHLVDPHTGKSWAEMEELLDK